MLSLNMKQDDGDIGALMSKFDQLPKHIAKKHLLAVIKRVGKDAVPILKQNTPKAATRSLRGTKVRGGALRRAATIISKYKGTNAAGYAYGVVGYKFGPESRKAIWLEYGTSRGIAPRRMVARTMASWAGPALGKLQTELAAALEKAAAEVAAGKNPRRVYSAGGSWRAG